MEVEITPYALRRLNSHFNFVFDKLEYTSEQVEALESKLLGTAKGLSKNPKIGQFEIYLDHLEEGHRRVIVGQYKIIYYITEDKIIVSDFFDTRQDPNKMNR